MTSHGIQLKTLKQCLMFLQWLHNGNGQSKLQEVARHLYDRISKYFSTSIPRVGKSKSPFLTVHNIQSELSAFLSHVSNFYGRLCNYTTPGNYNIKDAKTIADALLECLPRFLAVIYYLWYCIDNGFRKLGGGWWQYDWPGWGTNGGGHLDEYLHAPSNEIKYGVIPGGFGKDEVKYSSRFWHRGYHQGFAMSGDLQAIVRKGNYNFFRSVFVTSVIGNSASRKENTANTLALVRTFCDIVEAEKGKEGGTLKQKLEEDLKKFGSSNSICWQELKTHCAKLRDKLSKLFNDPKRFDFTGQSTDIGNLQQEELAKETANWLRGNVTTVRKHLREIKKKYGRTSCDGDLDRLVYILNGTYQGVCKLPEGTPNQGKKAEGAQNQGKKAEGNQNRSNGQSGGTLQLSPVADSADASPLPGDHGGTGPSGPNGDRGQEGHPDSGATVSSPAPGSPVIRAVQTQQVTAQDPPGSPLPPPPPPVPEGAPLPAQPGGAVPSSTSGDAPGSQPTAPQVKGLTEPTSASVPSAGSPGDKGTGSSGGQDVTLPTSPGADRNVSSGATAPAGTAPGGGGSG
ncbi:ribosome binding protein, putative [Babesia ovata]|uniref:Ribosome binding protein, putative n=1 Tax=Babesia ovata TaxID=189622 RepID=A0A2H6KB76_9APIC|nr:ribosome binding protein, putative [Babesia ovata]GBE60236.1 ribosome binding protein, putative [Babesia ovata]